MNLANWHRRLVETGPRQPLDYVAYFLFFPLSLVFGVVAKLRVLMYRYGLIGSFSASVPIISVGNLAAGGTGKTPVVDALVKYLLSINYRVAIVSRGYGRRSSSPVVVVSTGDGPLVSPEEGGDEPVLLSQRNPKAIVVVSPDRRQGIMHAQRECQPDVILLDDAFQHLKVRRDLDILLLDAKRPFSNGFPLPFGFLREFSSAVERADVLLLTRSNDESSFEVKGRPVFNVGYSLSDYAVDRHGEKVELGKLKLGRVGAFAGIANPESFFNSVRQKGLLPVETLSFVDHVNYGTKEQSELHGLATRCDLLLTTEKDLVKLKKLKLPCDCLAVPLELDFESDGEFFTLLDQCFTQFKEVNMLSEDLLKILACPKCKGHVEYDREQDIVTCDACKLAYPVQDGIPVMLVDEAAKL